MLQASKTKRGMDLASRNRTPASRTPELDKTTPYPSSPKDKMNGTRLRLFSLVQSQDSALCGSLSVPTRFGITK